MRISVAIRATTLAIAVWLTPSLALAAPTHAPVYSSNEANSSGRGVTGRRSAGLTSTALEPSKVSSPPRKIRLGSR